MVGKGTDAEMHAIAASGSVSLNGNQPGAHRRAFTDIAE
jgi:hypothetical protein